MKKKRIKQWTVSQVDELKGLLESGASEEQAAAVMNDKDPMAIYAMADILDGVTIGDGARRPPPDDKGTVSKSSAHRWLLMADASSHAIGYYVQSYLTDIPGANYFHAGAKRIGLVEPYIGHNRVLKPAEEMSQVADVLYKYFLVFTGRAVFKEKQADNSDHDTDKVSERLDSLEKKLDALLSAWDVGSTQ